jgi:integrase
MTLTITRRKTKTGYSYVVRYRLGGRAYPIQHGGSFRTLREARTRRDLIAGELAAGRNPALALAALTQVSQAKNLAEWAEEYRTSRIDLADETSKNLASHLKRILPTFGDRDPQTITWGDVQAWVAKIATDLKPSSVSRYMATLRLLLDFAGIDPNPARDRRVKLPTIVVEEPSPPTAKQFLAILDSVPRRWLLPLMLMEQTAMRVGEVHSLAWGDVDVAENRLRLRAGETKIRRARWVQVPAWLMNELALSCPLEDRTAERRVFPGCTPAVVGNVMWRACQAAGVPSFSPHDLRHRRLSIWHLGGVPAKVLAERAGHARASMSLDVYSHVLLDPSEVPVERFRALLDA